MNRAALGVTPGLERFRKPSLSLDAMEKDITDIQSFTEWLQGLQNQDTAQRLALHALVLEEYMQLEPEEQTVMRSIHIDGKKPTAVAREMGVHHSTVSRLQQRAKDKMKNRLEAVLRYRELEREFAKAEW